jgi:two-component system, sensor histidine kinase
MQDHFALEDFPVPSILADLRPGKIADLRGTATRKLLTRTKAAELLTATDVVAANSSALEMLGAVTVAELNESNVCFREEFLDWFHSSIERLVDEPHTLWSETIVYARDGRAIPVLCRAKALREPRHQVHPILWSFIDITPLKSAQADAEAAKQAAEAANQSKSDFLAAMSHEIRTPLNGVLGMAQLLSLKDMASDEREMVSVILQSGNALLSILNDLLDIAKIEAGRLDLEAIEFDVSDLATGAHNTFAAVAQRKQLSFRLAVDPEARGIYRGDPGRLRQILNNLISNAVKFTERGTVDVQVSRGDEKLLLIVRDTGIGIPADRVGQLFEKFTQADPSITRKYGGTGLGLAICLELAKLMDGDLSVESVVGEGSTFTFSAPMPCRIDAPPREPDQKPDIGEPSSLQDITGVSLRSLRILAAEDNPVNQRVLRAMLLAFGVDLTFVENGQAALDILDREEFDLVLMDVQMPVMDGITATREWRRREKALQRSRTPIVALSANAMEQQISEYLDAGMDGHIDKPIQMDRLRGEVERFASAVCSAEQPSMHNSQR